MLILTKNKFLKIGLESVIKQYKPQSVASLVLFDSGRHKLYLFPKEILNDKHSSLLYTILVSGICLNCNEIKHDEQKKIKILLNRCPLCKSDACEALTRSERNIINTLCMGISQKRASLLYNIDTKTVSTHKNNALRKLNMGSLQELYFVKSYFEQCLRAS